MIRFTHTLCIFIIIIQKKNTVRPSGALDPDDEILPTMTFFRKHRQRRSGKICTFVAADGLFVPSQQRRGWLAHPQTGELLRAQPVSSDIRNINCRVFCQPFSTPAARERGVVVWKAGGEGWRWGCNECFLSVSCLRP